MNRQKILVLACVLASVSIGGNVWLLSRRNEEPPPPAAAKPAPALPTAAEFDFKGTAFEDGSWKLTDDEDKKEKAPVFGGTALEDESWKLQDDKKPAKEGPPAAATDKPAEPEVKAAPARPAITRSDFSETAFEDNSWRLRDSAEEWEAEDEQSAVTWDKPFRFEEFTTPGGAPRMHLRPGYRNKRITATLETIHFEWPPGDGQAFERAFCGNQNLEGWDYREAGPHSLQ